MRLEMQTPDHLDRNVAMPHLHRACWFVIALAASLPIANVLSAETKSEVRLVTDDSGKPAFEAVGIPSARLAGPADSETAADRGVRFLTIHVAEQDQTPDQPAMLGHYTVQGAALRFTPRYALRPGVRYRATFSPSGELDREPASEPDSKPQKPRKSIVREFTIPDVSDAKPTTVEKVYPSGSVLPENLLRFYVYFSAPMSRGEAYRHVSLIQQNGEPVDLPFLELGEELWDSSGKRLTLLIDPGRIKRGVKPREDLGPVFEDGKSYTLVIDRQWKDASGHPLASGFQKKFVAGPPVNVAIEPKSWKVTEPAAGTSDSVRVKFPRSLDRALLERNLEIESSDGSVVPGKVTLGDSESRWEFHPDRPWPAGEVHLVVDTVLEDLVGNRIGRPFEVDRTETIERQVLPEKIRIPLQIKGEARVR